MQEDAMPRDAPHKGAKPANSRTARLQPAFAAISESKPNGVAPNDGWSGEAARDGAWQDHPPPGDAVPDNEWSAKGKKRLESIFDYIKKRP